MPAHLRVLNTLLAWEVNVDEAFFLGGLPKTDILRAFRPHIFFDDQEVHCIPASKVVSTGRVPGQPTTVPNVVGKKNQRPPSRNKPR
jgi:5'-nucleotidase